MSRSRNGPAGASQAGGEPPAERVQKVLARTGLASRRAVEEMIREGRVTVNGSVAVLGQRVDPTVDTLKVDGRRIAAGGSRRRYLLLNKPRGCVSTSSDPEGRSTVIDLLPANLRKGLFPVGRLDFETEGLLVLTDDGEFAQRVAHPRYGCRKIYQVKVKGRPPDSQLARLKDGIVVDGRRVAVLAVAPRGATAGARGAVNNSWWTVTLGEGRTRQIREMFLRIGHPVSRLRRVAIGSLADSRLPRGAWRELTEAEVERLRNPGPAAAKSSTAKSRGSRRPAKTRPPAPAGAASPPRGRPTGKARKRGGGRGRRD